jgi:hypothetical protein
MSENVQVVHPDCEKSLDDNIPDLSLKHGNNSFNSNDKSGEILFHIAVSTVVFTVLLIVSSITLLTFILKKQHKQRNINAIATAILFVISVSLGSVTWQMITSNPIRVVYAASHLLSKRKRTPPVLEPETKQEKDISTHLVDRYPVIKREILELISKNKDILTLTKDTYDRQNEGIGSDIHTTVNADGKSIENGWSIFSVSVGTLINETAKVQLPELCKVISMYPDILSCVVSVLPPRTKIPPHIGYSSFVKRMMLGIQVPTEKERCYLCVNGQKLNWVEGGILFWDDTFCHSVYNETDEERIIVYLDIRRYSGNKIIDKIGDALIEGIRDNKAVRDEITRTEKKTSI